MSEPRMRVDDPGENGTTVPRVGIAADEDEILSALANDRIVLELGTGLGFSTRALLRGGPAAVVSVDPDPWVQREIWPTLSHVRLTCASWVPGGLYAFDLVFIDGEHTADAVERDTAIALRYHPKFIVYHDWLADPRVQEGARKALPSNAVISVIPTTYGLGLVRLLNTE